MDGNSPQIASSSNTPILNSLIRPANQNTNHIRSNVIQRTQSPQPIVQNGSIAKQTPNQNRPNQNQAKSYSEALSRAAVSIKNLPQNLPQNGVSLPQNLRNHPIALEMVRLVNLIGTNPQGQRVSSKKLQFQGIVKVAGNPKVIQVRRVSMTGKKLTFNQKAKEMQVGLGRVSSRIRGTVSQSDSRKISPIRLRLGRYLFENLY